MRWARTERVDVRILEDWENEVVMCIKNRIRSCKRKHPIIRKRQVLRNNKHLEYIKEFHERYVMF